MPVLELNHINIKAPSPLLKTVRDFYVAVVGLTDGPRPAVSRPGHWLYAGDKPIVHLMACADGEQVTPGGHLDHVAFTCSDLPTFEARLTALGHAYRRNDLRHFGLCQLFVEDPTGLGVELNFPADEAG